MCQMGQNFCTSPRNVSKGNTIQIRGRLVKCSFLIKGVKLINSFIIFCDLYIASRIKLQRNQAFEKHMQMNIKCQSLHVKN